LDLLVFAKHLFVAAKTVWRGRAVNHAIATGSDAASLALT
jgi:hypothetical protein